MVSAAVPRRRHRSLIGLLIDSAPGIRRLAAKAAPFIREHLVSAVSFSLADYGIYGLSHWAGWVAIGVTGLVLDWMVRG